MSSQLDNANLYMTITFGFIATVLPAASAVLAFFNTAHTPVGTLLPYVRRTQKLGAKFSRQGIRTGPIYTVAKIESL